MNYREIRVASTRVAILEEALEKSIFLEALVEQFRCGSTLKGASPIAWNIRGTT